MIWKGKFLPQSETLRPVSCQSEEGHDRLLGGLSTDYCACMSFKSLELVFWKKIWLVSLMNRQNLWYVEVPKILCQPQIMSHIPKIEDFYFNGIFQVPYNDPVFKLVRYFFIQCVCLHLECCFAALLILLCSPKSI